jgi:dihydroorotate dehydrogenase
MFRLVEECALINRMGFNNSGARAMAERLEEYRKSNLWPQHPVGINLGKSKSTSLADAPADYSNSFRALWSHADFFVLNVSSPNTPNLRQLQDKAALDEILAAIQQANEQQAAATNPAAKPKPILVKVAPDLSFSALDEILELSPARKVAGIVATNTTVTRPSSSNPEAQKVLNETGGLSGRPLAARSTEIVSYVYRQSSGKLPIIGVGGVFDSKDGWDKIAAGASLIQVYTGLVYEGPGIVKGIVTGLSKRLEERGFKKLSEAVGCSHR